ncbi:hypothetical protein BESB_069720 [Besnoitia besnoiti]|uniref:Uncharacterized protein n=1 Tax=Besnoitia besnoiti TaxID=94643 RepID=A0A2A9MAL5_BESBE|nr:hypothetical protein BESB_069720 [Besnoitia besnoiti]PFH34939.1 hypothetical protein BESB_069720 [Besnoitia besnoiti]
MPSASSPAYSAEELTSAREAFALLVETANLLLPSGAAPSTPLLLLLTRLCEEGWDPIFLAELVVAAQAEKRNFLLEQLAE